MTRVAALDIGGTKIGAGPANCFGFPTYRLQARPSSHGKGRA